jgi:hypothetical protein
MYCFKCGSQISDNSIFCHICGVSQPGSKNKIEYSSSVKYNSIWRIPIRVHFSSLNLGLFTSWLLINFVWIVISDGSPNKFFPFSYNSDFNDYAFSEFIIYTIVPIVIYVIIFLFANSKRKSTVKSNEIKALPLYFETTTPTLAGLLIQITILIIRVGLEEKVLGVSFSIILIILIRILVAVWIAKIAEKLNRKVSSWVLLGYLFPTFALLIINHKRKID